jgi:capsular exopolysaccharide synthesis family protein
LDETDIGHAASPGSFALDAVEFVVRHWRLLGMAAAIGAVGGLYWRTTMPTTYFVSTKLFVEESVGPARSRDEPDAASERDTRLNYRVDVIRSITVADGVVRLLDRKSRAGHPGASGRGQAAEVPVPAPLADLAAQVVRDGELEKRLSEPAYVARLLNLRAALHVNVAYADSTIAISMDGADPALLTRQVNAYAMVFRAVSLEQKTAHLRRVADAIQTRLESARTNLTRAEAMERELLRMPAGAGTERDDRSSVPEERTSAEALPAAGRRASPPPAADWEPHLRRRRAILWEARTLLAQLAPLDAELAAAARAAAGSRDVAAAVVAPADRRGAEDPLTPDDAEGDEGVRHRLATVVEELRRVERAPPAGGVRTQLGAVEKLVAACDALYSVYLARHRQAGLKMLLASPDVHIVDPAAVPSVPAGPRWGEYVQKGIAVGLAITLAWILARGQLDVTLKGRRAIARVAGLPILGAILQQPVLEAAAPARTRMVAHEDPASSTAEAIREIRTAMRTATAASGGKFHLITSAGVGEGKTTLAANLAISLAQIGERVLLVDADLRQPQLSATFALDPARGISELLSGGDAERLIQSCAIPGLSVIASSEALANPAEFLCSSPFQDLLRSRRALFDRILCDSPPVNLVADAGILSGLSDSILLVVREGRCTQLALETALERLRATGVAILGVVVNGLDPPSLPAMYAGYYPGYSKYSSYRKG